MTKVKINRQHNQEEPMYLREGLEYKDLVGMIKPTLHVDEFASKMGEDDEIVVVSFFLRDSAAADDLVNWFEKGYDFVMDADRSPGEIRPNRFLVYIELKRRSTTAQKIQELLEDLSTLTDFEPSDWIMHYDGEDHDWSVDEFNRLVPNSPKEYRQIKEADLNQIREAAGLETKPIYEKDRIMCNLQNSAGI